MSLNRDQIAHEYILSGVATTVHSAFQLADSMIAEAQKRKDVERPAVVGDGWIRVEDRLPEENIRVLLFDADVGALLGLHLGKYWYLEGEKDKGACITHWQPLPSPPKGALK